MEPPLDAVAGDVVAHGGRRADRDRVEIAHLLQHFLVASESGDVAIRRRARAH
jgi:hypothetical protein